MEIRTVRRPGDKGTRQLLQKYGERLICIRYCYDPARRTRLKTVELIESEEAWLPPEPHSGEQEPHRKAPARFYTRRGGLRLAWNESELRRQIKAGGGLWDPAQRLWFVPEEHVRRLGLMQRMVTT